MKSVLNPDIVDKYLIKEVLAPFFLGVAVVTVIMLSSFLFQFTDLIIIKNVELSKVLRLLAYRLPEIIVQTLPIAILFGTMSGVGRLNRENELTAMRMGGFSLYRLMLPLIILGLLVSGITFYLNEGVVPRSNHRAQTIIRQTILKQAMPDIKEDIFFKGTEDRLFYVREYDQKSEVLRDVIVYQLPGNTGLPEIITAREGRVVDTSWQLTGGLIHRFDDKGQLKLETRFEEMELKLAEDMDELYGKQQTPSEMSREELGKEIRTFQGSGIDVSSLLVDYHIKLAKPLVPLIFILIGAPLALGNRESRALNLVMMTVIIFLYYFLLSLFRSLGKNGVFPPLVAAWLPNLIFLGVGVFLLILKESWVSLLKKLLPGFLVLLFLLIPGMIGQARAQTINFQESSVDSLEFSADTFNYKVDQGLIEISGQIRGNYRNLYILAQKAVIELGEGERRVIENPREIDLDQARLTGCDYDKPHYFFRARTVVNHPGQYLKARHVTLWELQGQLPLFYWPYLYISLREHPNRFIPEIGHHQRRGWFAKFTYNYWTNNFHPGSIYLDYYNISGPAGGFKHYLTYEKDRKNSLYFYTQENRTNLSGLFNWEAAWEFEDSQGDWRTDSGMAYIDYDDHYRVEGGLDLDFSTDKQWLRFDSGIDIQNYYQKEALNDRELNLRLYYTRELPRDWELGLDYDTDYLLNPEDGLKERWGSEAYLSKKTRNHSFRLDLERYAPRFTEEEEEDQVSFLRWPELEYRYHPGQDWVYRALAGRYYEDSSETLGYRLLNQFDYKNWWYVNDYLRLHTRQVLTDKRYRINNDNLQQNSEFNYQNYLKLYTQITDHLSWSNTYDFTGFTGDSPFRFDESEWEEKWQSELTLRRDNLRFSLEGGYNIYDRKYLPINAYSTWQLTPGWELQAGLDYSLENDNNRRLALTNRYDNERWWVNNGLKYDLSQRQATRLDNQLIYELEDEWYIGLETSLDLEDEELDRGELILKKNFHCRQLWFRYNHSDREFMVEYHINLFPGHGFKVGSKRDDPLLFDLGLEELLKE
ncbi:MAG: LptF/LptG family permease [Bacillota bacterium]